MSYNNINATIKAWRCAYSNNCCRGIISHLAQTDANEEGSTISFINNLEITKIFKDEDKEEEASVTDFIS